MKAQIYRFEVIDGKQRLTLTLDGDFRNMYEEYKDKDIDIAVSKWSSKRSNDANRYLWVMCDKIASRMHTDKAEVYRDAIKHIGGVSDMVCVRNDAVDKLCQTWEKRGLGWQTDRLESKLDGCTNVVLYYGSSVYNKGQMRELIDNILYTAEELGIDTENPNQQGWWDELMREIG